MKILFCTNNENTYPLIEWLRKQGEEVFMCGNKIDMQKLPRGIDYIISYNYKYIIKKEILNLFPHRAIKLHTSLLPWNKGAYPNLWSWINETPKGVTIHEIDEGIDTGDILEQHEFFLFESMFMSELPKTETLRSTYNFLNYAMLHVFEYFWENKEKIISKPQLGEGSYHKIKDIPQGIYDKLNELEWDLPVSCAPVLKVEWGVCYSG